MIATQLNSVIVHNPPSVSSGALPPGLTLNATTGVLSGTPSTAGPYEFTVGIPDANG